jgi:hypothetical protein
MKLEKFLDRFTKIKHFTDRGCGVAGADCLRVSTIVGFVDFDDVIAVVVRARAGAGGRLKEDCSVAVVVFIVVVVVVVLLVVVVVCGGGGTTVVVFGIAFVDAV